ncbi:hypothetical protein FOH38_20965 [Lysinibacillus fusiformis]|nr:hypothetical protein FOH38_20965 [Lysinibacillus fusiformis]
MRRKPIYVEIDMQAPMKDAWEYTQNPKLHEQWDLRFTSITYLEKKSPDAPQQFTYETKVMPGLKVSGWGESKGEHHKADGTKTSSLHFGTPQKISPIAEGKGYWQYIPKDKGLTFLTQYDYDVRYGKLGVLFDYLFRSLIGWATALSFDVLKRWLEKGENPLAQYRRFFLTMLISILFCFVWLYHGLAPKVMVQHPDEVMMIERLLGYPSEESLQPSNQAPHLSDADLQMNTATKIVFGIGIAEILFALCWLLPRGKRLLFSAQIIVFPLLTISAVLADKNMVGAPFNPVTLNAALWVLSIVGFILSKDLPSAKSCKRKRG